MTRRHYTSPRDTRRPRGSGRALSRRAVKQTAAIGQWWTDLDSGVSWRVAGVHRTDGLMRLECPGVGHRYVTFGELGRHYSLEESG